MSEFLNYVPPKNSIGEILIGLVCGFCAGCVFLVLTSLIDWVQKSKQEERHE